MAGVIAATQAEGAIILDDKMMDVLLGCEE
jgi:hypothetical protein